MNDDFSENQAPGAAGREAGPDFVRDFDRVARRVRALGGTCSFGFWFITDLHVPSNFRGSGGLLARFVRETGLRAVVCGGDVPEAFGDGASLEASVAAYREDWVLPVERAGGLFFPLHGNHDFTIRAAADSDAGVSWPQERTRETLFSAAAVRDIGAAGSTVPGERGPAPSCAYFADFPDARVRLVAIDTHDAFDSSRSYWCVADGVSAAQADWIARRAIGTLPDGWSVVAASHAPLAGVAAEDRERAIFAPVCGIFAPLAREGRVLAAVSGHHHAERQSRTGGAWHVTEPCDAAYLDYIHGSQPWVPDLPPKERGTWAGQTFDAVQFDLGRGIAFFTRVGGGTDRAIHLRPVRVAAGGAIRLAPEFLDGPVSWACHDGAASAKRPNPARKYDYFYDYRFDVAEIGPDGVLRAKAPGDAVAIAAARDGARELFAVEVA
ncbi:MAG: metallophosphoesterase [Kiritimatiellae bacterium]|nr:metallophosphoesterase [Kiritimatiellia bacterium]